MFEIKRVHLNIGAVALSLFIIAGACMAVSVLRTTEPDATPLHKVVDTRPVDTARVSELPGDSLLRVQFCSQQGGFDDGRQATGRAGFHLTIMVAPRSDSAPTSAAKDSHLSS